MLALHDFVYKCDSNVLLPSPSGYQWLTTPVPSSSVSPVGGCKEKEYQCENGRCVPAGPLGVVCDGVNDCGDGSDEMYCGELSNLTHISFIYCIRIMQFCVCFFFWDVVNRKLAYTHTYQNWIYNNRSYIVWSFPTRRDSAIPYSYQSTWLPFWSLLLPSTRGLHWGKAALWWDSPLPQRRGWNRLPSPRQRHYPVRQVEGIIIICSSGNSCNSCSIR